MFGCESRVREIEGLGPLVVVAVRKIKSTKNLKEKKKKKKKKRWKFVMGLREEEENGRKRELIGVEIS